MYLQYLYFSRQKTKQKPGKAHTKINANAKKPKKSQEKYIQKSPRAQKIPRKAKKSTYKNRRGRHKTQEKQRKAKNSEHLYAFSIYNTDLIHI